MVPAEFAAAGSTVRQRRCLAPFQVEQSTGGQHPGIRHSRDQGFTITELLVVMVVVGVLLALLLPAVQMTRESARRVHCVNNLRQIGLGILTYEEVHRIFPPAYFRQPRHNMLCFILPQLEQHQVQDRYHFDQDWYATANKAATETNIDLFVCPSAPGGRKYITDYATCEDIWVRTKLRDSGRVPDRTNWENLFRSRLMPLFPNARPCRIADVTDGLSNTFMLFEDGGRPQKWVDGHRGDPTVTPTEPISGARWADDEVEFWIQTVCGGLRMINCTNANEIYSFHPGGCNFLYGDGHVRFHLQTIDPDTFVSLFTRAACDPITNPDW